MREETEVDRRHCVLGLVCCSALSSFPLAGVAACFPWLLFSYLVLVVGKRGHFRFFALHMVAELDDVRSRSK